MNWQAKFNVSSRDPLPTVLVILGFIAAILMGFPAYFFDIRIFAGLFIIGWTMIIIGIGLWLYERQS